jgi:hypothetical protein
VQLLRMCLHDAFIKTVQFQYTFVLCEWKQKSFFFRERAFRSMSRFDVREGSFFSTPRRQDSMRGPPSLLSNECRDPFTRGYGGRGVTFPTKLNLVGR